MFRTERVSPEEIILRVSGPMTGTAVQSFETALNALAASHYRRITLDLAEVAEVSSLFIGHILNVHRDLVRQNRQVRIRGYQESVGNIFRMLNVDKTIRMEQDEPAGP